MAEEEVQAAEPQQRKALFGWASIAGADPEPVEIVELEGRKAVYTLGCADPFYLDEDPPRVTIYMNKLLRPHNPMTREEVDKLARGYEERKAAKHGWRGAR